MGKVLGMRAERKRDVVGGPAVQRAMTDLDARIEMIQALIPLGLEAVHETLQQAVEQLASPGEDNDFHHWQKRLEQQLTRADADSAIDQDVATQISKRKVFICVLSTDFHGNQVFTKGGLV